MAVLLKYTLSVDKYQLFDIVSIVYKYGLIRDERTCVELMTGRDQMNIKTKVKNTLTSSNYSCTLYMFTEQSSNWQSIRHETFVS